MKIFKDFVNKFFLYNKPLDTYDFSLPEESRISSKDDSDDCSSIYNSLTVNMDYINVKYNTLINSDIIVREFTLTAKGKEYKSALIFIDGMVKSEIINNFILRPLMSKSSSVSRPISSAIANNITVKKVKKFNLENYIYNSLIPQNSIDKVTKFKDFISAINSGECGILVDTLNVRICFRCKRIRK